MDILFGNYPYKRNVDLLKSKNREAKITGLLDLLSVHHANTFIHTCEVAYIATLLDPSVEVFELAMVHDIGKTGISEDLLMKNNINDKEKKIIGLHGALGEVILKRVGLGDIAYASVEHHIGNSKSRIWTEKELSRRHALIEIISMADIICAALDPRRPYHTPDDKSALLEYIEKKVEKGVFSTDLFRRFQENVLNQGLFPPFKLADYANDSFFITQIKNYGLFNNFQDQVSGDETARSDVK